MPFVPGEIVEEEQAFARFEGGCILCTTIEAELSEGHRVVLADDRIVVVAPFWSGSPFELLAIPAPTRLTCRVRRPPTSPASAGHCATPSPPCPQRLGDVAYNLVFHTAPHHHSGVLPLARPHLAEAGHDGRLRAGHGGASSTSCRPSWPPRSCRRAVAVHP